MVVLLGSTFAQHNPFQTAINVQQADSVLKIHKELDHSVIIIDIRTEGEYSNGFIEGAVNHNYYGPGFNDTLAALDKNKEYLIYCASGGRSGGAFSKMKALEFKMVYNMLGGVNAWKSAGFPVIKGGTGINTITNNAPVIELYPNPITSESVLVNTETYLPIYVRIMNIQGQSILQTEIEAGRSQKIDYDRLEKGIYFFQAYSDGVMIQSGKFLKNR